MKTLLQALAIALLCYAQLGCITPDASMESYLGLHKSQVFAQWGPPTHKYPDGKGGEVWTYVIQKSYTSPAVSTYYDSGRNNNTAVVYNQQGRRGNRFGSVAATTDRGNRYSFSSYRPASYRQWEVFRSFFINKNGIVYHYAWKGL